METIEKIKSLVNTRLTETGMNLSEASIAAVGNKEALYAIMRGRVPSVDRWQRICNALGIDFYYGLPQDLPEPAGPEVEWKGEIAAGGAEHPNDCRLYVADEHTGETISPPPALTLDTAQTHGGLFAVTVRGGSMSPVYNDGDVIYMYKNDPTRLDISKLIGQDCAVTLSPENDSAVYLKRLRGPDNNKQGHFNLESLNPAWPTMTNVQIQSAIPVRYVKRAI